MDLQKQITTDDLKKQAVNTEMTVRNAVALNSFLNGTDVKTMSQTQMKWTLDGLNEVLKHN